MKRFILATAILAITGASLAQTTAGTLKGKIHDENGEALPQAVVSVGLGDSEIKMLTDLDGRFTIKPLNPGTYILKVQYTGYATNQFEFVINPDDITMMNDIQLKADQELITLDVVAYKEPLIDPNETAKITITAKELKNSPVLRDPKKLVQSMSSDIKLVDGELYFRGSRSDGIVQFIDGVKQSDRVVGLPGRAIGRVSVYTGGIPAKYGDTTSGVIVMETQSYFDLYNAKMAELERQR